MSAAAIVAAVNAAITVIEALAPAISALFKKGEITVEQQAALSERLNKLRPGGGAFTGPEWEQSTSTKAP